jgi:ATP-dependent Clp protease ATP-binding subunit ClpC
VLSKNMGSSFVSPEHLAIALFSLDDPTTNNLLRRYVLLFVFHCN